MYGVVKKSFNFQINLLTTRSRNSSSVHLCSSNTHPIPRTYSSTPPPPCALHTHTHTLKHVHVHTHTCTYTHTHPNPTPSATQWLLECPCSTSSPDKSLPNPWGHSSLFVSLESQWPSWTIMCLFPYQSTCWPKMKASSLLWLAWSSATNLTLQALSGLF